MSKHWFVIIGITLFTGCYPAAKMTQGLVGITSDYCSDQHPVLATLSRCYLKQPYDNYGITKRNANDIVAGRCLLLHAVADGRDDVFDALLRSGAEPKQCGPDYQAKFYRDWIQGCHIQQFKERFDQLGLVPSQSPQELLELALHWRPCAEGVEFAVSRGADPNALDADGYLPLDAAVSSLNDSNIETAAMLVKLGADPFKVSPGTGVSPYEFAAKRYYDSRNWPLMKNALLQK